MAQGKDKNYISVWWWLWSMFVVCLPCLGWIMIIYWALAGDNQSRKNYFRAVIVFILFWMGIYALLMSLGFRACITEGIRKSLPPPAASSPTEPQKTDAAPKGKDKEAKRLPGG